MEAKRGGLADGQTAAADADSDNLFRGAQSAASAAGMPAGAAAREQSENATQDTSRADSGQPQVDEINGGDKEKVSRARLRANRPNQSQQPNSGGGEDIGEEAEEDEEDEDEDDDEEDEEEEEEEDDDDDDEDEEDEEEEDEEDEYYNSDELRTDLMDATTEADFSQHFRSVSDQREPTTSSTREGSIARAEGDGDEQQQQLVQPQLDTAAEAGRTRRSPKSDERDRQPRRHGRAHRRARKGGGPAPIAAGSKAAPAGGGHHYNTVNDSLFINYNGIIIILPLIFNAFQDEQLERAYQQYSHGQRQKALIIAHAIDLVLKLALISLPFARLAAHFQQLDTAQGLELAAGGGPQQQQLDRLASELVWLAADEPGRDSRLAQQQQLAAANSSQLDELRRTLVFGPLRASFEQSFAATGQPHVASLELAKSSLVWLLDTLVHHRLATLFCLLNLCVALVCACVPHKYLNKKLGYLALATWFMMCLENVLIYNSNEYERRTTIESSPDWFRPVLERQFDHFKPLTIWHTLIVVFITYAMMPMALAWSFLCSVATCLGDLVMALSQSLSSQPLAANAAAADWWWRLARLTGQTLTKLTIYLTINLVCLYTKYLIDLAQRNAFLETRRSIETRAKIEAENDKQERLLLSLLPRFVALEIIADIAKEENHEKLLRNQFHKIYIHSYTNVR
jgi:hypothetical protein